MARAAICCCCHRRFFVVFSCRFFVVLVVVVVVVVVVVPGTCSRIPVQKIAFGYGFSILLRVTSCKKLTEEQTALRRFSTRGYRIPVNIRKNGRRTDPFQALGFPARNGLSAENDRNFRYDTAESGIPDRKYRLRATTKLSCYFRS